MLYKYDEHVSFGVSLQNVGSMSELRDRSSALPTTVRLGSSYTSAVTDQFNGTVAMEAVKTLDDDHLHLHASGELQYDHFVSLRAGYVTGYEFRSFSTGFGVLYTSVKFDYAFVPFSGAFNSTHSFSLSFLL